MGDPQSVDEWLALAKRHEAAARAIAEDRDACGLTMHHCGTAVECCIKAYIMHAERLNRWPTRGERDELFAHDLRKLMLIADITVSTEAPFAPGWHVMSQWDRNQDYEPKRTPRRVARSYVEAAFGEDGIATWIRRSLLRRS